MAQLSPLVVQDRPPGLSLAVYDVTGPLVGAVHDGVTRVSPLTATTASGADGGPPTTSQLNDGLVAQKPKASVAVTVIPVVVLAALGAVPVINPFEALSVNQVGRFTAEYVRGGVPPTVRPAISKLTAAPGSAIRSPGLEMPGFALTVTAKLALGTDDPELSVTVTVTAPKVFVT